MILDPTNLESIKRFFEENKYLSTCELAILANRSPTTIRNWKRRCGIPLGKSPFSGVKHSHKGKPIVPVRDERIWDNEAWFRQKYEQEGLGILAIAKTIGRSKSLVIARLRKYDIVIRSHADAVRSNNPACNEEWLYKHYCTREQYIDWCKRNGKEPDQNGGKALSIIKCAAEANVVPYTIYNWLVRFKIPMRDTRESLAGIHNPFYGRRHTNATKAHLREKYWRSNKANCHNESKNEGGDP